MKRRLSKHDELLARQRSLLVALSDDLTLPFNQIKTSIDLAAAHNFESALTKEQANNILQFSQVGIELVEAYRLLLKTDEILQLPLEPVSIGALLEKVAHQLHPYARQYEVTLSVDIQGKFVPVLANEESLLVAIKTLSTALIRASAGQDQKAKARLVLGAHRSGENMLAAGVFGDMPLLSDKTLRAARSLMGDARQPIATIPPGSASGILVADMLCASLWQPLRKAAHRSMGGLATNLPLSKQLQFV